VNSFFIASNFNIKQGSSVSRNQSLIKKNIAPQDLKPSDIHIERFVAWKAAHRLFTSTFPLLFYELLSLIDVIKGVADIEHNTAKEMTRRLSAIWE
jgi:hypothetical protein